MPVAADLIHRATDARDLARRLGVFFLDNHVEIQRQLESVPTAEEIVTHVEDLLMLVPEELWMPEDPRVGALSPILTSDLTLALDSLSATPGIDCLAMLKGICGAALVGWFHECFDLVMLERGDPFPLPARPTHKAFSECTAFFTTTRQGDPLVERFNFGIYGGGLGAVAMNFECREALDRACWSDDPPSFPAIAMVSPYGEVSDLRIPPDEINHRWWFGTGPTLDAWANADIVSMLKRCKNDAPKSPPCSVALLPELSLPKSDALKAEIIESWHELPELIVLGSAHVRSEAEDPEVVRANESIVYIRGVELFRHRKRHPFQTKDLSPDGRTLPEGLTPESVFHLASGTKTRFAVLICVDAMDPKLVSGLHDLGVNFLLVPALSAEIGSFNVAVAGVPSASQGLCIVANGTPPGATSSPLFMGMAGVPVSYPLRQTEVFMLPNGRSRRSIGVVNPNASLSGAVTWL